MAEVAGGRAVWTSERGARIPRSGVLAGRAANIGGCIGSATPKPDSATAFLFRDRGAFLDTGFSQRDRLSALQKMLGDPLFI